jgi:hypothetical protein
MCKPLNYVASYTNINNWKFLFSISNKERRGDFKRHKRKYLKSNAMNAVDTIQYPSNPRKVNLFIVVHVSRNASLISESDQN